MFLDCKAPNTINFGQWDNKEAGYSLTMLNGKASVTIIEVDKDDNKSKEGKIVYSINI
jgi:hypothetical protein